MRTKTVGVVGAGPGGLATAMLLAKRGFNVRVFEKSSRIGGRSAEVVLGPYRFDLGPTFLLMKYVMDGLFEDVGRKAEDYLDCRALDPMYRLQFHDKTMLARSRPEDMRREIEQAFPGEGAGLDLFLSRERTRFLKLYPCLQKEYGSLSAFLSGTLLSALPHIAVGRSLHDVLGGYFQSEELRLAFTFQSKYLGMSPWDCPGLFAMIPYAEHAHGIYHVMGGLCRIGEAFAQVAREEGAEIRTSCAVEQVLLEGNKAIGLLLEDGEKVHCDQVVINADFGHAMSTLFPNRNLGRYSPAKLSKRDYSCSTFMMYLGLDRIYPDAEHHMIVFARDYKKALYDITKAKTVSEDLSLYVRNASPLDPSCAPPGHSALYILTPVPNNTSEIAWSEVQDAYRESILRLLEERTPYKNIRNHIKEELIITPEDWEQRMAVFLGATFNLGHSWNQMLYFRPHNRFELFDNVFLVGGGTHPGSGLPTIFESARISSNMICEGYGVPHPPLRPFVEAGFA